MAGGTSQQGEGDQLATFREGFPTQVDCMENKVCPNIRVFWSQNNPPPNGSPSDWAIHEKIKSAFCNASLSNLNGLIQFWAPVNTRGRRLLTTCDQPFALEHLGFKEYRLSCIKYGYCIEGNKVEIEVEEESMIISGAAAANAFLDHVPKLVWNERVLGGNPLEHSALECELMASLMLPVFDPCQRRFVGVVECSTKPPALVSTLIGVRSALEKVGLTTVDEYEPAPDKAIGAKTEIKMALKFACKTLDLSFAQAWSGYGKEVREIKRFGCVVGADAKVARGYHENCQENGRELVLKTLDTYKPHFCRNIYEVADKSTILPTNTHCSYFVMCLRTIATSDVDFAFQFLWPQTRDYLSLLDSLLSTLKMLLPSFKFDDELRVVDVAPNGTRIFNILLGTRLQQNADAPPEEQSANGSSSTLKRKRNCKSESQTVNIVRDRETSLPIKVKHGHKMFKLYVSPRVKAVRKVLDKNYGLISCSTYGLEYLDEEKEWIVLAVDEDFTHCIQSWRIQDTKYIQMRVVRR